MSIDTVEGSVAALEGELGLPAGFLYSIKKEDYWSFIIKLHALIEAAVTRLLVQKFGEQDLLEVFSRLELSNKKTGKMAFVSSLDLLNRQERRFIGRLSELRNLLIHNVHNVVFDLKSYASQLEGDARKNFAQAFWYGFDGVLELAEGINVESVVLDNPKDAIWASGLVCLAVVFQIKETERLKKEVNSIAIQLVENMRSNIAIIRPRADDARVV